MAWNARITKEQEQGEAAQLAETYAAMLAQAVATDSSLCGIVAFDPNDAAVIAAAELAVDATTTTIGLSSTGLEGPLIFANLAALETLTLSYILITTPPDVSTCTALTTLDFTNCTAMVTPPDVSTNVLLTILELSDCTAMVTPPDVTYNTALADLLLDGCTGLDADDLFELMTDLTTAGVGTNSCVIDISGIVPPNAATMALIYTLCQAGATVTCDAPEAITVSGTLSPNVAGDYTFIEAEGYWLRTGTPAYLWHNGTHFRLALTLAEDTNYYHSATVLNAVGYTNVGAATGTCVVALTA